MRRQFEGHQQSMVGPVNEVRFKPGIKVKEQSGKDEDDCSNNFLNNFNFKPLKNKE